MVTKRDIIKKIENKKDIIKSKGVTKLGLFGSFVKGKQHRNSDIDILVSFDNPNFGEQYFELLFYLQDLFKRKIDLIPIDSLRKELNYVKQEAEYVRI
jgi:predicted nucleotidyltransferase